VIRAISPTQHQVHQGIRAESILRALRRRAAQHLSVLCLIGLLVTHVDPWRPQRAEVWFGWLPEELLWRLLWMLAAWAFVAWFTRAVWAREAAETKGEEQRP
jgi:hypothetical protein